MISMENCGCHVPFLGFSPGPRLREILGLVKPEGTAPCPNRAFWTTRQAGQAEGLSQFHHRLIEVSRLAPGKEKVEIFFYRTAKVRLVETAAKRQKSGHDASYVAIDNCKGLIIGNAQHCPRRIIAYTRKGTGLFEAIGELSGVFIDNFLRRGVQVSRPPVISQTGP